MSNVPGPTVPLYYSGCKLTRMAAIVSTGRARSFLPLVSYNKQFSFLYSVDSDCGIDSKEFLEIIDNVIEETIAQEDQQIN